MTRLADTRIAASRFPRSRGLLFRADMAEACHRGMKIATRRLSDRCAGWKRGDVIYVRETWAPMCELADPYCGCDGDEHHYTEYRADTLRHLTCGGWKTARFPGHWDDSDECGDRDGHGHRDIPDYVPRWRSSMHMPRERARTYLVLTADARREPLHAITVAGAMAEGVGGHDGPCASILAEELDVPCGCPRCEFAALWDSINGAGSWGSNPTVTVLEFTRIFEEVTLDVTA